MPRLRRQLILHRVDFAQSGVQKPLVRLGISVTGFERLTAVNDQVRRGDHVAIGVVQSAVGEPHDVAGQTEGDDLAAPVFQNVRQTQHPGLDFVQMRGRVAFTEQMCARRMPPGA